MPFNTAFFQCAKHGSVYMMRDAHVYTTIDYRKLEPLIEGVEQPSAGDHVACPLCGGGYRILFTDNQIKD